MPLVTVTRRYRFSASHRLHSPVLSEELNRQVYGKCNNPYGHGHNYTLEVCMSGRLDAATGRLVPLGQLDALVETTILRDVKWRNLNVDVPEFAAVVPTSENLARVIARRLADAWHVAFPTGAVTFERVRIHETKNNFFEAKNPRRENRHLPRVGVSELQEIR